MKIARRVERITPSLTLEVTSLAKRLKAKGEDIVNFAAGEPDFDTPNYIKQRAIRAVREGITKYTPATGLLELKQAIAKKFAKDNRLTFSPSQIIVSSGAKHALYNILQVLCEERDEVLIISPYWVSYPAMVELAQGRHKIINTQARSGFKLDVRQLNSHITKKTKVLILNSPANPTGCVYSRSELEEIAQVVIRKKLYLISDEIYEKLIFDGKRHTSIASINKQIFKRTIVVNGVSKAYAMTGWRIGYLACADEDIIQAISKLQSHSTSNPSSISQMAALAALEKPKAGKMQAMVKEFEKRRNCMIGELSKISRLSFVKPEGAFYVFCGISKTGLDSVDFARRLLKEAKIAVIPGKAFGWDGYVRLSFATSVQQIEEGLRRLRDWINHLS